MRNFFPRVIGFFLIFVHSVVGAGAVTYPASTPIGEQTGGWFQLYFDNMFTSEANCKNTGKVVGGFTSTGIPLCVTPVASGLFVLGQTAGDTLRFNGTDWVRSNLIYNDGTNIGINTQAPGAKLDINGTIKISGGIPGSGRVLTSDTTGLASWQMPTSSTSWELTGNSGLALGTHFLGTLDDISLSFKVNNTKAGIIGNTANSNTYFGLGAGTASNVNLSNVGIGKNALFSNVTGQSNTANGLGSLFANTIGSSNTANGFGALLLSTGNSNTALGYNAGSTLTTGGNNIFIGANTIPNIAVTASNQLNIGNWIYGNNGSIGIGVLNPGAKLDIAGTIKITDGTQGNGKVLVSDANGLATWVGTGSLGITASGFTIAGSTLGSTLYYNGTSWIASENIYNTGGNIGIGTSTPGAKLDVNGTIKITGGTPGAGKVLTSDAVGIASWATPAAASSVYATGVLGMSSSGGYVTKFMPSGSGITSSAFFENNGKIGMGTTTPTYTLDVQGSGSIIRAGSGFCLGTGCVYNWSDLNNVVKSMGTPNYLAKFDSNGLISNSQIYETGGQLWIGDVATVIAGGATKAFITIKSPGSTNSSNPFLTLSENGGQECRMWITGANKLGSNCSWTAGLGGSYQPNQVIKADAAGTDLTGSSIYESVGNVGIGIPNPTTTLDVNGQIRLRTGASSGLVLVSDTNGVGSWQVAPTATTVTATGIIGGVQNYVTKFGTGGVGIFPSMIFDNGAQVGIGTATPLAGTELDVTGDARFTGNVTVQGSLVVDKIVNRTINNVSVSGSLIPDALAPMNYRDIGTNTGRWNNLYLSGQVTIGGGSPGLGKFLTSDANGLASWTGMVAATSLNLAGAVLGNTLYFDGTNWIPSSNIYNAGGNVGIGITGTAPTPTSKFEVWSGGTTQSLLHFRGSNNLGLGLNAVRYLTSGSANVGLGNNTLRTLTTGYSNSAFGDSALYNNMQGYFNTAGGSQSLYTNSNGNWNVALGSQSLYTNLGGSYNIGLGGQALYLNAAGNSNIGIGYAALRASTGDNNVAIGDEAGSGLTSGSNNIVIGANVQLSSSTASNQLNIGNWIYGNGGNVGVGTGSNLTAKFTIDSGINNISGLRLSRINSTSPVVSNNIVGLGVNGSGEVVPVSNGDVIVYDGISSGAMPNPDPNNATKEISYDFNKFFSIPARQSFVVSDGSTTGKNAPYIGANAASSICKWTGTYGTGMSTCPTTDDPGSPYNSFTMSARGQGGIGYQLGLAYRGDVPLMARAGYFRGDYGSGLYLGASSTTPAPWFKVFTVPTNHIEYFYIDTGYTGRFAATGREGRIGIGTILPDYLLDVRGQVASSSQFLGNAGDTVSTPSFSWQGDTNAGMYKPATDTIGFVTNGSEAMRIFSNGNVTIGGTTNSAKLRVDGQVMITGGTPGAGKVLTSDANGLATWQTPSSGGGSGTGGFARYTYILSSAASTTSSTLADLGVVSDSLPVGNYNFKFTGKYRTAATTTGIGFSLLANGATITGYVGQFQAQSAASAIQVYSNGTLGSTALLSTSTPTANTDFATFYQGTFSVTSPGAVKLQYRSEVNGSQVTVQPGSNLVIEQL